MCEFYDKRNGNEVLPIAKYNIKEGITYRITYNPSTQVFN